MKLIHALLFASLGSLPLAAQTDRPAVPARINYQGFATDLAGVPLGNAAPANFDVQFRLYTAGTGGTLLWAEQQTVTIAAGQFSVLLGNGVALNQSTPRPDLGILFGPGGTAAATGEIFLGITINNPGQSTAQELSPRQQLVANPFSLRAMHADLAQAVAAGGVPASAIVPGAVGSAALADGSVGSAKLGNGAVGPAQLAPGAVTSAALANEAVTEARLASGAVTAVKLATGAVTSDKLAAGAVTQQKLAPGAVDGSRIQDGSILAADLANGAVTPDKTSFATAAGEVLTLQSAAAAPAGSRIQLDGQTCTISVDGTAGYPIRLIDRQRNLTAGIGYSTDLFLQMQRNIGDPGTARLASNGAWFATSDARMKRDIKPAQDILRRVLHLTPVTYRMRGVENAETELGFTAQDVAEEFPQLVLKGSDTWSLNYAGLSVVAIGALIEEHELVRKQGERLAALEKENAELAARLDRLEKALGNGGGKAR